SAVMTTCPPQRSMSASRKRDGTASLPLLSRLSCATPRNTTPPDFEPPAPRRATVGAGSDGYPVGPRALLQISRRFPTFLHLYPLYEYRRRRSSRVGFFYCRDKDLYGKAQVMPKFVLP